MAVGPGHVRSSKPKEGLRKGSHPYRSYRDVCALVWKGDEQGSSAISVTAKIVEFADRGLGEDLKKSNRDIL